MTMHITEQQSFPGTTKKKDKSNLWCDIYFGQN